MTKQQADSLHDAIANLDIEAREIKGAESLSTVLMALHWAMHNGVLDDLGRVVAIWVLTLKARGLGSGEPGPSAPDIAVIPIDAEELAPLLAKIKAKIQAVETARNAKPQTGNPTHN